MTSSPKKFYLFLLTPLLFLLSSCSATTPKAEILTSFYPMTAFTKAIVGDTVTVKQLVPPTIDIHDYEPSAQAVAEMTSAHALVYNANDLEKWILPVETKAVRIEAARTVKQISTDPHTWLSPKEAILEVQAIANQLERVFPQFKTTYEANAKAYIQKLQILSQQYESLRTAKQKIIITQHDAFSYLARDYGLTAIPIAGLSPDNEPSPHTLALLKEEMSKHHIKTIFFEEDDTNKIALTLAQAADAKTTALNTLETVDPSENYLTLMQKNLKTLESVLNA